MIYEGEWKNIGTTGAVKNTQACKYVTDWGGPFPKWYWDLKLDLGAM